MFIKFLSQRLELGEPLAKVVVFEVTACVGILELSIRVLIYVNSFEVCKIDVVNIRFVFFV